MSQPGKPRAPKRTQTKIQFTPLPPGGKPKTKQTKLILLKRQPKPNPQPRKALRFPTDEEYDNCLRDLIAFREGGEPGLCTLERVQGSLYECYNIGSIDTKMKILLEAGLEPRFASDGLFKFNKDD